VNPHADTTLSEQFVYFHYYFLRFVFIFFAKSVTILISNYLIYRSSSRSGYTANPFYYFVSHEKASLVKYHFSQSFDFLLFSPSYPVYLDAAMLICLVTVLNHGLIQNWNSSCNFSFISFCDTFTNKLNKYSTK